MDDLNVTERLSQIMTHWSKLRNVHLQKGDAATRARHDLLRCYHGALYRYAFGLLQDRTAAEEITQDFAVRFLRGDFRNLDPKKGRFRDFLGVILRNLAMSWLQKQNLYEDYLARNAREPDIIDTYREDLFDCAYRDLAKEEQRTRTLYYTVLCLKTRHPELTSEQIAEQITLLSRQYFTAKDIRRLVHGARDKFAQLLLTEISRRLGTTSKKAIEEEVKELRLLPICQSAVNRMGREP